MIELPNTSEAFRYEDAFLLTCRPSRLAKLLALYELYRMSVGAPGVAVECGVFRGASLCVLAMLRSLLETPAARPLIAFDTFTAFPPADDSADEPALRRVAEVAGLDCIAREQLLGMLEKKGAGLQDNLELVEGDIRRTVPEYVKAHPELKISFLSIDVDLYGAAKVALEELFPRLADGGVLLLDNYGTFPGETRAADEFFAGRGVVLRRLPFARHPAYMVKGTILK